MFRQISFIFFLGLLFRDDCSAQTNKPPITPEIFDKFSSVTSALPSNDGNYVLYNINDPTGNTGGTYLKAIHGAWQSGRLGYGQFTNDSRYYIYKRLPDTLAFLDLSNTTTEYITGVASYKQAGKQIGYFFKSVNKLVVRNVENKNENVFNDISDYYFNDSGTSLILVSNSNNKFQILQWINLESVRKTTFWAAETNDIKVGSFTFSKTADALAFVVESKDRKSIWYYREGMNKAIEEANSQSLPGNEFLIEGIDYRGFSRDGSKLFIKLNKKPRAKPDVGLDIWSYTDSKLQSEQQKEEPRSYVSLVDIENRKLAQLESKDDRIVSYNDQYAVIANIKGNVTYDEWYWNKSVQSSVYLISLNDGSRTLLDSNLSANISNTYRLSPNGNYIVYYNAEKKCYFSYKINTRARRNITSAIKTTWTTYIKRDIPMAPYMPIYSRAGWIKDEKAVLLYDQYDIYEVDPSGNRPCISLTSGFGRKNNIQFTLLIENNQIFNGDEEVLLSAFNRQNKNEGFYKIKLGRSQTPQLISTQPYKFKGTWEDDRFGVEQPKKAKKAEVYVVRRMSASEAPNFFWTTDFKKFHEITKVHPEENYNWLTTELITWKLLDGSTSQGILYKPQNFDVRKKYPVIFHYYENYSEGLNGFITPEYTVGALNIPYYVSNGYLVFTPDFHYELGHTGKSVVSTVVSAANYLSRLPYVDRKHMGIQGHSRGGWETNFIVAHTNIFAAGMSAAGFCNYVSLYNGARLLRSGESRQTAYEKLYQRMGTTLWDRPDLYIENSPIFSAPKVRTPVLMMSNKSDDDVPFEQGVEFYSALRRLGKRVWMLQYDEQRHIVFDKAAEDLELRMKQFFDHYLKDSACPRWMLYGVPASEKGNPAALQLVYEKDKNGQWLTPKEGGLLTDDEKKKIDALQKRKPITITLK